MSAKAVVPCLTLLLCLPVSAQPEQAAPAPLAASDLALSQAPLPAPALRPQLRDKVIRDAVRETLAESLDNPRRPEADTIRGNSYTEFVQQFSEARVPDCLHGDALKRQPPMIGGVALNGLFAVPFVALAKIRGKCN